MRSHRITLGLGLFVLLGLFSIPGVASANPDQIDGCVEFFDAVEREDGSLVAIGTEGGCPYDKSYPDYRYPANLLVGLKANGATDRAFGDEGSTRVDTAPGEIHREILARPDGGFIAVSNMRIRAFGADGRSESGFGQDGQIELENLVGVAINSTGVYPVQSPGSDSSLVRKFDQQGQPVLGYGSNGSVEVPFVTSIAPAVDSQGRVVLAEEKHAFRVTAGGTVDTTFGTEGSGVADPNFTAPEPAYIFYGGTYKVEILAEDRIRIFFSETPQMYSRTYLSTDLDSSGVAEPHSISTVENINLRDPDQFGIKGLGAPGNGWINRQLQLGSGGSLSVGAATSDLCGDLCQHSTMGVLAKKHLDGSGNPGFGSHGFRLVPQNECRWGQAGANGKRKQLDWNVCRVSPPRIKASVKLKFALGSRPVLDIRVTPGSPPEGFLQTTQRLNVTLPGRLPLSRNWRSKVKAWVTEIGAARSPVDLDIRKRKLFAQVKPALTPGWEYETPVLDPKYRFRVVLRRGAIKPIGKKSLKRGFKTALRAEFVPNDQTWFAGNSRQKMVKLGR